MVELAVHLVISAALLMLMAKIVNGVEIDNYVTAVLAALVLGLVNAAVRPVMVFLTIPITLITFGLFLFVINALMLWLVAALVPGVEVRGFGSALVGSFALSLLNLLVGMVFGLS